jgi:hypothetical protein
MDSTDDLISLKAQVAGLWARYRQGPPAATAPGSNLAERLRVLTATQRKLATRRTALKDERDRQRRAVGQGARVLQGLGVLLGLALGVGAALASLGLSEHADTTTRQVVLLTVGLIATLIGAWRR